MLCVKNCSRLPWCKTCTLEGCCFSIKLHTVGLIAALTHGAMQCQQWYKAKVYPYTPTFSGVQAKSSRIAVIARKGQIMCSHIVSSFWCSLTPVIVKMVTGFSYSTCKTLHTASMSIILVPMLSNQHKFIFNLMRPRRNVAGITWATKPKTANNH